MVAKKKCACPRCGLESSCSHGRWWDRHPVAAVLFALPAGYTLIGVMLVYPWFTIPATIILCAVLLNRAARQRAAVAARADHEHRELIARAVFNPQLSPVKPLRWLSRPRGADHWAPTQPIWEEHPTSDTNLREW